MTYPQNSPHGHAPQYTYPQYAPPPQAPAPRRRWPWVVGLFAAFLFGYSVGNVPDPNTTTANAAPTYSAPSVESVPEPAPATQEAVAGLQPGTIPQGDWLVGDEVTPGTYRSTGAVPGLFELCSATTTGADGNVIDWNTGNAGEQVLIKVTSSAETVSNSGCNTFTKVG